MAEVLGVFGGILGVIYFVGALFVTRRYYVRRHGVGVKFNGDTPTIGHYVAASIGLIWPVIFFSPALRNPQLCTCPDHVLARKQAEQEADSVREQLDRERGTSY